MSEKSRTEYSFRNTTAAMISRMIAILMGFFTRVVFTHTLSQNYVGVNGLFSDILNVLSLSELGVGTAITYALYKPIAEHNVELLKSLMALYKKIYYIIAGVVLGAGLMVIPFMDVLIKNRPEIDHLVIIYVMYLSNSVLSYLLIYKRTLIDAHQLSYIGVICQTVFLVAQDILQIILLLTTKNFILFLAVYILCTIGNNLWISKKAEKLYPYLKDKNVKPLEKEQKQGIYKNIKAMLMHKIGNVVINNTDNLLLSAMVGIVSVGCYSNYYLVIGSVRQVLNQMFQGIMASVGNLGATKKSRYVRKIFETSFFAGQWMFGFATICLYELVSIFVGVSFGSRYVFSDDIVFILCLNFYITGMRQAVLIFRDSLGLFWYDRYKSIAEALLNLALSIILAINFGTMGVFLGTLFSALLTSVWIEPYMLYKYSLKCSVKRYFKKYVHYVFITMIVWAFTHYLCGFVQGGPIFLMACRLGICIVVPNIIMLLCYHHTDEFEVIINKYEKIRHKQTSEKTELCDEELKLLSMLKASFDGEKNEIKENEEYNIDWNRFFNISKKHAVTSFLYDEINEDDKVPEVIRRNISFVAKQTVIQSYRLLFLSRDIVNLLQENGVSSVLLKGVATAGYYPIPELRKSGDIDVLLYDSDDIRKAADLLSDVGCVEDKKQTSLHQVVFKGPSGIHIELHVMIAEPFDNEATNMYLKKLQANIGEHVEIKDIMGVKLPVLCDGCHAFELLLHMLQHYMRSGFGLKLLCDWKVLWDKGMDEKQYHIYKSLVTECKIIGFSDMISSLCINYLNMCNEKSLFADKIMDEDSCLEFMLEIIEAEEFGKSSSERMVTLRNAGGYEYLREFHHQMRLNYPLAGKFHILWPVLWGLTLIRFITNNYRVRKTSTLRIIWKANQRSRKMKKIRLFKH